MRVFTLIVRISTFVSCKAIKQCSKIKKNEKLRNNDRKHLQSSKRKNKERSSYQIRCSRCGCLLVLKSTLIVPFGIASHFSGAFLFRCAVLKYRVLGILFLMHVFEY